MDQITLVIRVVRRSIGQRRACSHTEQDDEQHPDDERRQKSNERKLNRLGFRLRKIALVRKPRKQNGDGTQEEATHGPTELHSPRKIEQRHARHVLRSALGLLRGGTVERSLAGWLLRQRFRNIGYGDSSAQK